MAVRRRRRAWPIGWLANSVALAGWLAAAAATAGAGTTSSTSSGSNAANYGYETQLTVNQRTADLTLQAELANLPGIVDDVGVSVTLSYSSGDATSDIDADVRYFGLPFGWKYNQEQTN